MSLAELAVHVLVVLSAAAEANKIGYFWHLTDIHWDPNYGTKDSSCQKISTSVQVRKYGEYHCDAPWALVESAARAMLEIRGDVEFILWTGDSLTRNPRMNKTAALANLTTLLNNVFSGHFVLPVLGHDDPDPVDQSELPYKNFSDLWKHWMPEEALVTFRKGGYYTFERTRTRLRLVAINTNLTTGSDVREDPEGQWQWLEGVLKNSRDKNETVYIVGHMPPGMDERGGHSKFPMAAHHSSRYLSLVRNYSDIITGQFFGHLHSDTFRIVYNNSGTPVSRLFLAPSLSPRRSSAGHNSYNNPGVRLYKIEIDTGQVLDYNQYFLDLATDNEEDEAEWSLLYNFTDYYNLQEPSPEELHILAENFTVPEGTSLQNDDFTFKRFVQANSVNATTAHNSVSTSSAHGHYCAITKLDSSEYFNCQAATPAPLAAVTAPAPTNGSASLVQLYSYLMYPLLFSLWWTT